MAHIADFMVDTMLTGGLNNYIAREVSLSPSQNRAIKEITLSDEKEAYVWRMHQPSESRKYQLFPAKDKLTITAGRKSPDAETVLISTMGQAEKDRSATGGSARPKPREETLIRRRKASVPDLGPMTTVQELAMDSPTIPGRPPLHERSISAPGNSWRQHMFGESMLSCISGPILDENAENAISDAAGLASEKSSQNTKGSGSPKQTLSPKSLAPLIIPSSSAPQPQRLLGRISMSRLRSGSTPPDVPPKSARMKEGSPYRRFYPFTPMSASTTSLVSTASTPLSSMPSSAPERRSSPKPWSAGPSPNPSSLGHSRGQSETTHRQGHPMGHRREESDASIMDRGRPKKRSDGTPVKLPASKTTMSASEDQKAFETLPSGYRPQEAPSSLPATEIESLRKQAMGQASRFEVLGPKDVETLSRELRGLDERCEYLQKTHRSLRSGRRNLHARICTYLRSPRVARFSHESILKQEETLSELDASIDDWVSKLEQAENRRTRVRQKLLEHVAAALMLPPSTTSEDSKHNDEVMERKVVAGPTGENTPPRSPTKAQSPQRLATPVQFDSSEESAPPRSQTRSQSPQRFAAPVQVDIPEEKTPPRTPTKSQSPQRLAAPVQADSPEELGRASAESIRIYADTDVCALLADVEDEIKRMSEVCEPNHEAAMNAGFWLNAAVFSPPRSVGYNVMTGTWK